MNKPTIALIIAAAIALFAAVLIQKSDAVVPPQRYLVVYAKTSTLNSNRSHASRELAAFWGGTNAWSQSTGKPISALEGWMLDAGFVAYTNSEGIAYSVAVNWQQNMTHCTPEVVADYVNHLPPVIGGAAIVWDSEIEATLAGWGLFKSE